MIHIFLQPIGLCLCGTNNVQSSKFSDRHGHALVWLSFQVSVNLLCTSLSPLVGRSVVWYVVHIFEKAILLLLVFGIRGFCVYCNQKGFEYLELFLDYQVSFLAPLKLVLGPPPCPWARSQAATAVRLSGLKTLSATCIQPSLSCCSHRCCEQDDGLGTSVILSALDWIAWAMLDLTCCYLSTDWSVECDVC